MPRTNISRSPPLIIVAIFIGVFSFLSPEEKSLGVNVRIVYLHGAWVLTGSWPWR